MLAGGGCLLRNRPLHTVVRPLDSLQGELLVNMINFKMQVFEEQFYNLTNRRRGRSVSPKSKNWEAKNFTTFCFNPNIRVETVSSSSLMRRSSSLVLPNIL
jgi:hypothetical protein